MAGFFFFFLLLLNSLFAHGSDESFINKIFLQADCGGRKAGGVQQVPNSADQPTGEALPDAEQHHER